jgi:hypothetical protein
MVRGNIPGAQYEVLSKPGFNEMGGDLPTEHVPFSTALDEWLGGERVAPGDHPQAAGLLVGPIQGYPQGDCLSDAEVDPPWITVLMPPHRRTPAWLLDEIGASKGYGFGPEQDPGDG